MLRLHMAQIFENIIVGAGMAGLSLGRLLGNPSNTLILEKSRGLGGRMATRRHGDFSFDHGAQFYLTSADRPFLWDERWAKKGIRGDWFNRDGLDYRVGIGGITALAKDLAEGQTINRSATINKIIVEERICLESAEGPTWRGARIFLTCPLPQSLQLLKCSSILYPTELDQISYAKALVGLFTAEGEAADFKYAENIGPEIFSVSNQASKHRSEKLCFNVVMRPAWSEARWDMADEPILKELGEHFTSFASASLPGAKIKAGQLKKWRYSHPLATARELFVCLPEAPGIYLLGDAFGGPSLGGALRSARAVAASLA